MRRLKLTIRNKLFAALAALAALGGFGGTLVLVELHGLARTYQAEQTQVAVHEAIHEDRIVLLGLLESAAAGERWPEAQRPAGEELQKLESSLRLCDDCHAQLGDRFQLAERFEALQSELRPGFEQDGGTPAKRQAATLALRDSMTALEASLGHMEARYHELLERRRESGRTILQPSFRQHLALVGGGLAAALLLAWGLSRSLTRPILSLIERARGLGANPPASPAPVPRDPDLAQVATALNEMAVLVAERAREDVRRQLLERTISSQEEERKRVARELHDELGQSLSALLLEVRTEVGSGTINAQVGASLERMLTRLVDDVHVMAWNLRPSLLDDLGLKSALSRYIEETSRRHAICVDFQTVGLEPSQARLPGHLEIVLYRVAQEALNNVVRHAHADRVSVVLVRRRDEVALLIEDNGAGFVQKPERPHGSLGIVGMEERLALVGGNLKVTSMPGKGTSVRASIPLPEARA